MHLSRPDAFRRNGRANRSAILMKTNAQHAALRKGGTTQHRARCFSRQMPSYEDRRDSASTLTLT